MLLVTIICTLQVWNFHSGRSRDCDEPARAAIGYDSENSEYMIENYIDFIKENSLATTEVMEDMYEMNCATIYQGMPLQQVRHSESLTTSIFSVKVILLNYFQLGSELHIAFIVWQTILRTLAGCLMFL